MKKILFALWLASLGVLAYGFWSYDSVADDYARQMDEQSIQIYRLADDARARFFVAFIVVCIVGVTVIGLYLLHQSYREAQPRSSAPKNAAYWDKVGWLWLVGYLLTLVVSCFTMSWNLTLGALGLMPSAYLLYRGLACLALSNELKHPSLAPRAYNPRRHPI